MQEEIKNNFIFLITDVKNQFKLTFEFLRKPNADLYDKLIIKDDYIDNLKNVIENKCFSTISKFPDSVKNKKQINYIRAIHIIAINLERIADFCVNIVRQVQHLSHYSFLEQFDFEKNFSFLQNGLEEILPALERKDLGYAIDICRLEYKADQRYESIFKKILSLVKTDHKHAADYITTIFIARYFERIGDSLLNIGEAILFYILGEKIKIHQFRALQETLNQYGYKGGVLDIDFQSIWGTRSGCRIGRIQHPETKTELAKNSIFKEGALVKIRKEKENLERWQKIFPGLVPRIVSYYEEKDVGSMLVEFLPGCGFDELIINPDKEILANALFVLQQTLSTIWDSTLKQEKLPVDYINQALVRSDSVYEMHPEFKRPELRIGQFKIPALSQLFELGLELEKKLFAPFSVFIHGDFNTNNILYDHSEQRVYFIDVYRSKRFDYVQDVSVFLVSIFRIPIFDRKIRKYMNELIQEFYNFAYSYALEKNDTTFKARLGLALVRSFFTSTRFELNKYFAQEMLIRSRYLLELLLRFNQDWTEFDFPEEVLWY